MAREGRRPARRRRTTSGATERTVPGPHPRRSPPRHVESRRRGGDRVGESHPERADLGRQGRPPRSTAERQGDALFDIAAFFNKNHDGDGTPRHLPDITLSADISTSPPTLRKRRTTTPAGRCRLRAPRRTCATANSTSSSATPTAPPNNSGGPSTRCRATCSARSPPATAAAGSPAATAPCAGPTPTTSTTGDTAAPPTTQPAACCAGDTTSTSTNRNWK
jgi:hypothetical protein